MAASIQEDRRLWDDEVRFHFENGRTAKTLELYIVKYRYALKDAFGPKTTPLRYLQHEKTARASRYVHPAWRLSASGVAMSIVEKIERAEHNTAGRQTSFPTAGF